MLNRVYLSKVPAKRTRWPISIQDEGIGMHIQINALFRWIFVYLD